MKNKQWTSQNRIKEKSANWRIFFWGGGSGRYGKYLI